ncbi:hypothetical protein QQF64_012902 [Cirrhinus molitorella]|uniref:Sodium channel regulatory subunit beta-1 n=1 Tax=Cirrhinus molitorella TaxID=172907 RepID=A0ABR3LPL8_9TELE
MKMMMKMADGNMRRLLLLCVFCAFSVSFCNGACAEVDSDTEAVAGHSFKLGCISCKMRGEVDATATVDWLFRARGEADFVHIYSYDGEASSIIDERFQDRVEWHGSKNTLDLQDASVDLHNVTFNDSGVYRCIFNRILIYEHWEHPTITSKEVHLTVVAKATRGTASIVSEEDRSRRRGSAQSQRSGVSSDRVREQRQLRRCAGSRIAQVFPGRSSS